MATSAGDHRLLFDFRQRLARLHLRDQIRDGERLDLHISDRADISESSGESKVKTSVAGTQREVSKGLGIIHMIHVLPHPCPSGFHPHRSGSGSSS